jgi:hypothetical protein
MVQCLVVELGAVVNQARRNGTTPLMVAAESVNAAVVQCLIGLGAEVGAVKNNGDTASLVSARFGRLTTTQYLLEDAGANIDDVNKVGDTVWDLLREHLTEVEYFDEEVRDPGPLISLLRVMVLRGAPPPALVALLSPEPARVVQEGAQLRARLPAYLVYRRAYLDLRSPRISRLPGVLRALIYGFEGPATTEELWATGLGMAP